MFLLTNIPRPNSSSALSKSASLSDVAISSFNGTVPGKDEKSCVHARQILTPNLPSTYAPHHIPYTHTRMCVCVCLYTLTVFKISFNNSHLFLIGVYRHPNVPASNFAISSLTSFVADHYFSILLGDFNAHYPMWGGTRPNGASRALGKCIDDHHLVVLNPPSSPTYISFSPYYTSTIDLIIASPQISSLCEAHVLPDLHENDHHPLEIRVN
ncbi:hypothetical protein ALC60_06414 [Trachymyrmex zeteki]|uniref:Endonuclease/exonuclease/phosphatase domain-containing protein n=1 Tax=Mycetomoellerius zeteki TaxID=64791 RepID=A0A151X346_9HYME|nr:hypothetical protein ALC60_06414 [Trachymyrmex zeteki]